jgi:hypothetical protein
MRRKRGKMLKRSNQWIAGTACEHHLPSSLHQKMIKIQILDFFKYENFQGVED